MPGRVARVKLRAGRRAMGVSWRRIDASRSGRYPLLLARFCMVLYQDIGPHASPAYGFWYQVHADMGA